MQHIYQGLVLILALFLTSCSSQAPTNKMGTPEYFWSGAKQTFQMKDYVKAANHLENLTKTNNQFTEQAYPWRLILLSGLSEGYAGGADALESGGKANRAMIMQFRKRMTESRQQASQWALQFAEAFQGFEGRIKGDTVTIAMPFPGGTANPSFQETQIEKGFLKNPQDADTAVSKSIDRHILLALCRALGAPENVAKAQQLLQGGKAEVPRAVFMSAVARSLYNASELYTSTKLDQPDRMEFLTKYSLGAVQGLPETKDIKDLTKKITERQKKMKSKKV